MFYPDYRYVDVAFGGVHNRNNVISVKDLKVPDRGKDCYRTVYRYPEQFKEHYKAKKSVSGYKGPVYADYYPMDIDEADDLGKAHETVKRVLNALLVNYELDLDLLRVSFSGAKGFHILVPAVLFGVKPSEKVPQAFKAMTASLAEGVKVDTSIYDTVRLFRLTNTINSKTGLYKIPLTTAEILHCTIDEILEMARGPRSVDHVPAEGANEYLAALYREAMAALEKPRPRGKPAAGGFRPPARAKLCYYKLMEGVGEGARDNAAVRLAVHHMKEYPPDIVHGIMSAWNGRNDPPLPEGDVEKALRQAETGDYDFGCNDGFLKEFCDQKCYLKGKEDTRVTADKIYSMDEARSRYQQYIDNLSKRKILLGLERLDNHLRGIAPGEVMEVIARTGVGKTAFLLNVIGNVTRTQKVPVLFFSLEQPLAQIYERVGQISTESDGRMIERHFLENSVSDFIHAGIMKNYKDLYVVDEDFITYEELRDFILLAKAEKIGTTPPLVCVDYLGRMKGSKENAYEVTSELAKQLKVLAKDLDIAVIYLHQTSRAARSGQEAITLDMARDSGVTEEAADFILGMWRPEINKPEAQEKDEEELVVAILKNRKGSMGQAKYKFIKPYLQIKEYGREEVPP